MKRSALPFRRNCEGYFTDGKENILARKNEQGFIIFPGGGIDEDERVIDAMIRETLEETGAVISDLRNLGVKNFEWGLNWAKTDKQRARYHQFKGEEMHFFSGKIKEFIKQSKEASWKANMFMEIKEVIKLIRSRISSDKESKDYAETQLKFLISL